MKLFHKRCVHNLKITQWRKLTSKSDSNSLDKFPETFKSHFMQQMFNRGYVYQCTNFTGLDQKFDSTGIVAYIGFDATASSLHVGSLLQIMVLRLLQKSGHKPVVLLGGGTTKIGDPTGRENSRKILSGDVIRKNIDSISDIFKKYLVFGNGPTDAIIVNNADWLDDLNYMRFLQNYGRHFTINRMLAFETVSNRLDQNLPFSFLEFNYMILQAYDFIELQKRHKVSVQLGGSDQWGNILCGVELGRKLKIEKSLYGLTSPLITTANGLKMGKSQEGAVWLNKDLLSEYDYWQYWRNTADSDVIRFLKLFTDIPLEEIEYIERSWTGAILNQAKVRLADEATAMLHGRDCLPAIQETASAVYNRSVTMAVNMELHNDTVNDETADASADGAADAVGEEAAASPNRERKSKAKTIDPLLHLSKLPRLFVEASSVADGKTLSVVDLLCQAKFLPSRNEARKSIHQGAVRVNDIKVFMDCSEISSAAFATGGAVKLSYGKKKHVLVTVET